MKTANLPNTNEVTLDHSGHFVADIKTARNALEELGFIVTPYSMQVQPDPVTGLSQPTGTGNICVMLPEGYIEVLNHTADTPIGLEFKSALAGAQGCTCLLLAFMTLPFVTPKRTWRGLTCAPLCISRSEIETETDSETATFTVARLAAGAMPEGRVQIVTHHTPHALWQPRWTAHPNKAQSLDAILISAPDPQETAGRFSRFLDRSAQAYGDGLRIALDRGALEILPEDQATELVGMAVDPGRSCFVGLRVRMGDRSIPAKATGAHWRGETLVVPFDPALGSGIWLFDPA